MHCMQSNSVFPTKHVRSLDLLDGTPESPQEHCHKSRRTLMSLQECEIARSTPNQLKMKPDSSAFSPELSRVTHHTKKSGLTSFRQLQRFPETPVSRREEHQFQHRNSRSALCTPYNLEMRADSLASTEEVSQLSTSISS